MSLGHCNGLTVQSLEEYQKKLMQRIQGHHHIQILMFLSVFSSVTFPDQASLWLSQTRLKSFLQCSTKVSWSGSLITTFIPERTAAHNKTNDLTGDKVKQINTEGNQQYCLFAFAVQEIEPWVCVCQINALSLSYNYGSMVLILCVYFEDISQCLISKPFLNVYGWGQGGE